MIGVFLFLACFGPKRTYVDFGAVDVIDKKVCVIQLAEGETIEIESEICSRLREGDVIKVVRAHEP